MTEKGVRITLIEPGAVDTELHDRITDESAREASTKGYDAMRTLHAEDVANAIDSAVTQPDHVAINEILVRPTDQPTPWAAAQRVRHAGRGPVPASARRARRPRPPDGPVPERSTPGPSPDGLTYCAEQPAERLPRSTTPEVPCPTPPTATTSP